MTFASYWLAKNEGGLPSYLLWQWRHNDVHTCCCQEVHHKHNHNCCGNTTHYLLLPGDSPHPQLPWQYNTLPAVARRFNTPTIAVATQPTTCCCQEVHHTHNWCSNTMDFLLLPLGSPHPQLLWQQTCWLCFQQQQKHQQSGKRKNKRLITWFIEVRPTKCCCCWHDSFHSNFFHKAGELKSAEKVVSKPRYVEGKQCQIGHCPVSRVFTVQYAVIN